MSEKWHHSEIHIAISDESEGSIAKNFTTHLSVTLLVKEFLPRDAMHPRY